MMTQFYAGLYANALRLAEKTIGPAPCGYAWIALGSLGRGEQLMRTDQDHALVMAEEGHETYFVRLAQNVSGTMQQLGFAEDHYGVSATNSLWQGSPTQWKNRIRSWITAGEGDALLQLSILLDARLIHGDLNLGLEVFNELYRGVGGNNVLLHTMAQDALRNPSPLGLFKQFKLEATGQFDLKLRAILPFIDAAKVLAGFAQKAHLSGTRERLEAIRDGSNEELVSSAQHAYEILLEMRSRFSAKDNEHGRYINPEDLDTLDRQLLRNVLKTLEALQSHLKLKFKL
jgi:CBS domain-containing protein